jgi:hypothetical protein
MGIPGELEDILVFCFIFGSGFDYGRIATGLESNAFKTSRFIKE